MTELVSISARVKLSREVDIFGLPIVHAELELDDETANVPLPKGRRGPEGPRGTPRTTFVRRGEIPNEAARPTGLGPNDRGSWWHRLDDNGMDVWTESGWVHSPNVVGPPGPLAPANTLDVISTTSDPRLRAGAMRISGSTSAQTAQVTVPAGEKGPKGPPGASGLLAASPDFSQTYGAVNHSLIAWSREIRKFRTFQPPVPVGLWAAGSERFTASTSMTDVDTIDLVSIDVEPLPFAWRPRVHAYVMTGVESRNPQARPHVFARIGSWSGPPCGIGYQSRVGMYAPVIVRPFYGSEGGTQSNSYAIPDKLTPRSDVGVILPGEPTTIYFRVERRKGTESGSAAPIGHSATGAYAQVQAIPVRL